MKKQSVISQAGIRKAVMYVSLSGLLFFGVVPHSGAQAKKIVPPVSINYAGTIDDKPLFRIYFDNSSLERYDISIKDDQGYVLYEQSFNDSTFRKSFLLDDINLENTRLSFTIVNASSNQSQVFEINKVNISKEEYVITKR